MYTIRWERSGRRGFDALPPAMGTRALRAIERLTDEPRPPRSKKLRGAEVYRIRVGDYRIVYDIDDMNRVVTLHRIAHRKDAYRD